MVNALHHHSANPSFRVVTDESRLAVLDIVADNWPCDAATVSAQLYPDEVTPYPGACLTRTRKILKVLADEGLIKRWSITSRGGIGWAPAEAPSFTELYLANRVGAS